MVEDLIDLKIMEFDKNIYSLILISKWINRIIIFAISFEPRKNLFVSDVDNIVFRGQNHKSTKPFIGLIINLIKWFYSRAEKAIYLYHAIIAIILESSIFNVQENFCKPNQQGALHAYWLLALRMLIRTTDLMTWGNHWFHYF